MYDLEPMYDLWWTDKQDEGYEVVLRKDGEDTVVELKRIPDE